MVAFGRWLVTSGRLLAPGLLLALLAMAGPLSRAHAENGAGTVAVANSMNPLNPRCQPADHDAAGDGLWREPG
jgi:hypothetical protein